MTVKVGLPLIRTKFHQPPVPADHVRRPELLDLLEKDRQRPLVLVSAPAGYGKSTLVSCWLECCQRPSAWLSLDESDNDLRQFLSYFVAAVQNIFPEAVRDTIALINAPNLSSASVLSATLINDLERIEQEFIVVLDDIHCIQEKAIHDFFNMILRHPSRSMQIVMIGRRDPVLSIAFLRGKGLLTEVRMRDLRFRVDESLEFLQAAMVQQIEESVAVELAEKSEGWVTGLRLAVLAMRGQDDPGLKLLELKGSTRYVLQYLFSEVLDHQPPSIRQFLLNTSILNRFCASLCNALCEAGETSADRDIEGEEFINWLQTNNLFLIPLDMKNRWFRYHYLFQQLLQHQLKRHYRPEEIAKLHSRASEWFEGKGLITESIKHALASGDVVRAAGIVERHRNDQFTEDRWYVVERWLAMLPVDIRRKQPGLLLSEAWIKTLQHQLARVPMLLDQAESQLLSQTVEPTVSAEIDFLRGYIAYFEGQPERCMQYLKNSVSLLANTKSPFLGEAELILGLARCMVGQKDLAVRTLEAMIDEVEPSENYLLSRLIAGLAFIYQLWGDLYLTRGEAQRLHHVSKKHKMGLAEGWSCYFLAWTHLHAGELEAASLYFEQAVDLRYMLEPRAAVDALAGLVLTQQLMRLDEKVTESCRRLQEFALELQERNLLSVAQSCQARLSVLRGDVRSAVEWGLSVNESPVEAEVFSWLEAPSITQARVLIADGSRQSLLNATELLQSIRDLCEACQFRCQIIEVAVLQSIALDKLGRSDEALTALEEVITLAGPLGWIRPFIEAGPLMAGLLKRLHKQNVAVEYIEKILAACRDDEQFLVKRAAEQPMGSPPHPLRSSSFSQPMIEPLTQREIDVLELLFERLQNKEMAEKLFISNDTIKWHLKNIYQKLGVNNRRQAVERAKNLGFFV